MRFPECKGLLDPSHSLSKAASTVKPGYEVFKALLERQLPAPTLAGLVRLGQRMECGPLPIVKPL